MTEHTRSQMTAGGTRVPMSSHDDRSRHALAVRHAADSRKQDEMDIPRRGDRLSSVYPFADTIAGLVEQVRQAVEARLGPQYRVIDIEASLRAKFSRDYESRVEIDPARIGPYVPEPSRMTFDVRAEKLLRREVVELKVAVVQDGLIVADVSFSMVW